VHNASHDVQITDVIALITETLHRIQAL